MTFYEIVKMDAVKLVTEQDYKASEAARNFGIHTNVLRPRRNQPKTDRDQVFPVKEQRI